MLNAFRSIFTTKEDSFLPSDIVHLYFNLDRSISIKVQINESTSCLEVFNRYSSEIFNVLRRKLNENVEKYLNLEEHFCFIIININCKETQLKLKGHHNPWKYIKTKSSVAISKVECNLYFLKSQFHEKDNALNIPIFKRVTQDSIIDSQMTVANQPIKTGSIDSQNDTPHSTKPIQMNKRIKKNKLSKIEGFNLNNIRRDGVLKELCFLKWKYIKKHVYLDPERLFIYDESSEEVNIIMFTEVISIKKYENKYKLEEAIYKIFKLEDIPKNFEYKEFSLEIKTEYNDIIILKSKNEYDLTNWVETLIQAFTSIRDIKVMKCIDQMIASVNTKIYAKEVTVVTQSFTKKGILSFYFQMELPLSINRMYQWVSYQFNKAVEEMEIPNSPISVSNFDFKKSSFDHNHLNLLKIFLVQGYPLLKLVYQYKDNIKTFHMNEAYQLILKINSILPSLKEMGKNGFSLQTLINNAIKESELTLLDSVEMGFKLNSGSLLLEKKSDVKWKKSCNCDDADEHNELKPIKEVIEACNDKENDNQLDNLRIQIQESQAKRSIIISKISDERDSLCLAKSCPHTALTKSSSISQDITKKKSSALRSEHENQSKFREEYFKCYVKELFNNLKSLEEELSSISSNPQIIENSNKKKSLRQTIIYARLKFETLDWLCDFIVEELPSYSAFTFFYSNQQLYRGLSLFLLVYLQNETFFTSKRPEQALIEPNRFYSSYSK